MSGQINKGRGGLTRDRNFLLFWGSETTAFLGAEFTRLTFPLIGILTFGASAFQVSLIQVFFYAPVIMFSLLIGVWLDRRRRHGVLVSTAAARALAIALIPLAAALSQLSLPLLYVVVFVVGALNLIFEIGSLSYLPNLVGRQHLAEANSRIQTSYSVAAIAGPGVGGVLVGAFSPPTTLVVTATGFALSAVLLATIRKEEPAPVAAADRPSIPTSIREGLHAVFANSMLRNLLSQSAAFNLLQNAVNVVLVLYVVRTLGLSPQQLGIVLGAGAVAALLAATTTNRITRALGLGRTLRLVTAGCCSPALLVLIPNDASAASVVLLVAAQALIAFNLVVWNINTLTLRQVVTPNEVLGRMNASYRMVLFGVAPLGALLGGLLGDRLGLRTAMVTTALLMLIPIGWMLFSPVFRLTRMPDGPETDGPGAAGPEVKSPVPAAATAAAPIPAPAQPAVAVDGAPAVDADGGATGGAVTAGGPLPGRSTDDTAPARD